MTPTGRGADIRAAYDAIARGDLDVLLTMVHPDVAWTYLDPSQADPEPQTCRGREELAAALRRQAQQGLTTTVEEIIGGGDRIVVVLHTPGLDRFRARSADDRNFQVLTFDGDLVVALRACRDRAEALSIAGVAAEDTNESTGRGVRPSPEDTGR